MKDLFETWIGRSSLIVLTLFVALYTFSGCTYKHYIYTPSRSTIGSYIGSDYYFIIYGRNTIYHLDKPVISKKTLQGQLVDLDSKYWDYLVADTVNTNFSDVKKRYPPAEACHIKTDLFLNKSDSSINVPLDNILSIHVYHWKMKKDAKIIVSCTAGLVFIGLIILGAANMEPIYY